MNIFKMLLGAPLKMVGDIVKAKQQRKANEFSLEMAMQLQRLANVESGRIAEVEWNTRSMANSSWRDEYLTILLSLPLILIFGPDALQAQIADGFSELQKLPAWYISGIGLMIGSAFGFQKYTNMVMNQAYTLPAVPEVIKQLIDKGGK